jgi:hypothetical protein
MAAGTALKIINKRVKHLARLHPGAKRITLQKQAGREYKAGKLGRVKHKTVVHKKKKVHRKSVGATRHEVGKDRTDSKRVNITVGSVTAESVRQSIARAKNGILDKLMYWEEKKFKSAKAAQKKKAAKRISELKSQYLKLSHIG